MSKKVNNTSTIKKKETVSNKTTPKAIPQKKVTPRQKTITLAQNKKNYNDLAKWSTYVLDSDSNLVLKYKEKFDQEEVQKLIQEAYETLVFTQDNPEYNFFTSDDIFMKYLHVLMVKYFTNLGKDFPDAFEDQIPIINELVATGLFEVIFEHVFDPNEVLDVLEKFNKLAKLVEDIGKLTTEQQEELMSTLNNSEILSGAFNGKV